MLARCRERAARDGLTPTLYAQAMHELDLPRRYRTVFVCGGFGLGGSRDNDTEALLRFRDLLEPGGTLALDLYVPYENADRWRYWLEAERRRLPEESIPPEPARRTADGIELGLRSRVVDFDPLEQVITYEMRARRWRDGRLEADERHTLKEVLYFRAEMVMMLRQAGFTDVRTEGDYRAVDATRDSTVLVFIAQR
jgi:hypothetical protein